MYEISFIQTLREEAHTEGVPCGEAHTMKRGNSMSEHVHENLVHQIENGMPSEEIMQGLAELFKVFGDVTRVKILCALFQSESCVCGLAEAIGMTQSAVSHQLRVLKQMKLVKNRREGKTIYYSLADAHIQSIINQGMEHITE